jgi:hypothetical protein
MLHQEDTTGGVFLNLSTDKKRFALIFADMSVIIGVIKSRRVAQPLPFALQINNPIQVIGGSNDPFRVRLGKDDTFTDYHSSGFTTIGDMSSKDPGRSALRWSPLELYGIHSIDNIHLKFISLDEKFVSHRGVFHTGSAEIFIECLHEEAKEWINANLPIQLDPGKLWPSALTTRNTTAEVDAQINRWLQRCLYTILYFEPKLTGVFGCFRDKSPDKDGSEFSLAISSIGSANLSKYYRQVKLQRTLLELFKGRMMTNDLKDFRRIRSRLPGETFKNEYGPDTPSGAILSRDDVNAVLSEADQVSSITEFGPTVEAFRTSR